MPNFVVRQSKFRHIFGQPLKRDKCYDNVRITKTSWESTYCAVSPKFVAIITEAAGGGSFLVMPLAKTGRISIDQPVVSGHKGPVYDLAWCPHNDNVIASASDDCTVKVWHIKDDDGLTENLDEPIITLSGHQKRVTLLAWHPTAQNVLATFSSDNTMIMWDVGTGEMGVQVNIGEQVWCASFNHDGSRLCCTAKDKQLRIIDTHTGDIIQKVDKCHAGAKPAQCVYLKNGQIFTTGFSRMSAREYALWNQNDLSSTVIREEIDNSNGVNFIFYDPDTNVIYLAGKGDSQIRYFEVTDEEPYVHFLAMYQSNSPQRGIGYMPKRGCNVNNNEIARFYKLHNNGLCEVIPFTVPRKSELFQDDLYPDTASDMPAISASEFFDEKKNAVPNLISLKEGYKSTNKAMTVQRKSNFLDKMPTNRASTASNNAEAAAATALPPSGKIDGVDVKELMSEMKELKEKVTSQDKRIVELESRLAALETGQNTDEEEVKTEA